MKNEKVEHWITKTLDQTITCPFCFETFLPQELPFRCIQPSPRCPGWVNDDLYAKKRSVPPTLMGHVFEAKMHQDKRMPSLGIVRSARCDLCFAETHLIFVQNAILSCHMMLDRSSSILSPLLVGQERVKAIISAHLFSH